MSTIFDPDPEKRYTVTHDETAGLQNATATPDVDGDKDDHDILLSSIAGLLTALHGLGAPDTAIGAARNQVLSFLDGNSPTLSFSLKDGVLSLDSELTTTADLDDDGNPDAITLVVMSETVIFGYANHDEATERVAFALVLTPISGGAEITIVQYEALHHLDPGDPDDFLNLTGLVYVDASASFAFDDFSAAPAGQNLWTSVSDSSGEVEILITGRILGSDTVNTRATSLGSNNQAIDVNEGLRFDFVDGQPLPTSTTAKDLANISFTSRVEGDSAGFLMAQVGGSPSNRVSAQVIAYDSDDTAGAFSNGGLTGAKQTITKVEVWMGSTLLSSWERTSATTGTETTPTGGDALLDYRVSSNDSVIIDGLMANYRVAFWVGSGDGDSDDTGVLDRFEVVNVSTGSGNKSFDLGGIRLGSSDADSAEVGSLIRFEDDGPTASAALGDGSVIHDETTGLDGDADDTNDAAVIALFAGVGNVSSDMTAGYAQGDDPVVDTSGSDYGQDEEGGTTAFSLDIADEDGTDSGLQTTDGTKIFLFKEGALVVGRIGTDALAAATGAAAFAVAIDADSGVLSLAQYASLWHEDDSDHDDVMSIAADALYATVTVTDGDGDQDSDRVDIGARVAFQDDGPTASAALGDGSVTHDETAGLDGDADDTNDAAVIALFAGVGNVSSDMTAGYAQGDDPVVDTSGSDYGQDEEGGTTAFSLDIADEDGTDSGLQTTDGTKIFLFKEGALVVGRIGTDALTAATGAAAFAVAIDADSGVLSLAQYTSLWHEDDSDHDDVMSIAADALYATVTVTDGDGDQDSDRVDIGARVAFQDDGPTASAALGDGSVTHDETAGLDGDADDSNDAAVIALFAGVGNVSSDMIAGYAQGDDPVVDTSGSDYGQDEEGGTTAFSLDIADEDGTDSGLQTTDGTKIFLFKEGDLVVGRIGNDALTAATGAAAFAVAIDANSGVLSLAQYASLWHEDDSDHDDVMSIAADALYATVTVTDGDGDKDSDRVDIGARVAFQDDGPTASAALGDGSVTHDETAGLDGDADDTNDAAVVALFAGVANVSSDMTAGYAQGSASVVDASGSDYGQDEEGGTTLFSLDIADEDGTDSGLQTTDGTKIFLFKEGDLVVGRIGTDALTAATGAAAFAVAIDADSGVLSLAQYASLWHEEDSDHNDSMSIAGGALYVTVTVTDGDGDVDTDSVDIGASVSFLDDGPLDISPERGTLSNAAGLPVSFLLDVDLMPTSFADNFGQDGPETTYGGVVFAGSAVNDGAALYAAGTTSPQLTSGGLPIYLEGFGTATLTAYTGSGMTKQTVFTVTLDGSSGEYSVDMDAKIDNGSISFDNFGSGGAGLRYWLGVAGDQDASKDLLVTGGNPGSDPVNNDSDDIAIGNQWIDPTEMVRLDFVNGIGTTTGTSNINNIPLASHYTVNDVGFTVMQTKANSQVDVRIDAIDAARNIDGTDGSSIAADLLAGTLDTIISVTVIDGTTGIATVYERSAATQVGNVFRSGDGKVIWDDNSDGDGENNNPFVIVRDIDAPSSSSRDQVFVSTADGFTRLEISNVDANKQHAFAIGGFEIGGDAGSPLDLAFDVNVVDGDGDMAVGLIGITLNPEPLV